MELYDISQIEEVKLLGKQGKSVEERITEIKIEKSSSGSSLIEKDFRHFNELREADYYLLLQDLNMLPLSIMIKYN